MPVTDLPFRPYHCVWELTLACNLSCTHCGSAAGKRRPDELSTEECLDAVAQLAGLGCRLITLSGGEPTLRGDWPRVVEAARDHGMVVNLVTNGTTLTAALARTMREVGLANVAVSLDGPRAAHEAVRGPGSFERSAVGLRRLTDAGLSTTVLTHLNRLTAAQLDETHQLTAELGARAWRLQLGKPMGRLVGRDELLARPIDVLQSLPRIARLRRRSPLEVSVGDSLGHFGASEAELGRRSWDGSPAPWRGCQAGRLAVGLESDGGVKGCLSLQSGVGRRGAPKAGVGRRGAPKVDPFREGSLRERRLEAIWLDERSFRWNRGAPVLSRHCRRCPHAAECRGGPACVASAFGGRLGENPYCAFRLEALARQRDGRLRRQAAALLLALGLGAAGCDSRSVPSGDSGPSGDGQVQKLDGKRPDAARADAARPDTEDPCKQVCCMCDYGVIPDELWARCCAQP